MWRCSHSRLRTTGWTLVGLLVIVSIGGCGGSSTTKKKTKKSTVSKTSLKKTLAAGEKYLAEGNRSKAIAAYSKAIKIDPDCKDAYVWRGVAYNESGDSKKALSDFSRAIKLDPTDGYCYKQRASIYDKSNPSKAAADRKKAEAIRNKRWNELPDNMAKLKKKMGRK